MAILAVVATGGLRDVEPATGSSICFICVIMLVSLESVNSITAKRGNCHVNIVRAL